MINKVAAAGGGLQQMYSLGENATDLEGADMKAIIDRVSCCEPDAYHGCCEVLPVVRSRLPMQVARS